MGACLVLGGWSVSIITGSMEAGTKEWSWSGSWKPVSYLQDKGRERKPDWS